MNKVIFRISLVGLFVAAVLGLILRYMKFESLPFLNFKNIVHTHSHIAMGAWVYLALISALLTAFVPDTKSAFKPYQKVLWVSLLGIGGMLLSFPIQGYALYSITFSQIYVIGTYMLSYQLWSDVKEKTIAAKYLKAALVFLCLSSLGPYAMGPLMAMKMTTTVWYPDAIYFYLHFQYNGWFIFALIALLLNRLEKGIVKANKQKSLAGFRWMVLGCVFTLFGSFLWSNPGLLFNVFAAFGALAQIIGIFLTLSAYGIFTIPLSITLFSNKLSRYLFRVSAVSFIIKCLMQLMGSIQAVATTSYTYRNSIIAYLHIVMLGVVSFFLFHFFIEKRILKNQKNVFWGLLLFSIGFFLSEFMLFYQAFSAWKSLAGIPNFFVLLFCVSICFPLGAFFLLISKSDKH